MRLNHPWKCDNCGVIKGESNHWFTARALVDYLKAIEFIEIAEWNEETASNADVKHCCGERCVVEQATRLLAKISKPASVQSTNPND